MTPGEFIRRKRFFIAWLEARGARILGPENRKRDLVRFQANGKVALVHRGLKDRLVLMNGAEEAWQAFMAKADWSAGDVGDVGDAPAAPAQEPAKPARVRKPRARRPKPPPYPLQQLGADGRVTAPGVYSMTLDEYHADPAPEPSLSSTGARLLHRTCPQIFWKRRMDPRAPTRAQQFGTAAHHWILEGATWEERYVVLAPAHSNRSAIGRSYVEKIEARGQIAIPYADMAAIRAMKDALEADPWAMAAFRGGQPERSLFWRDPYFGVWCRTRPDYLPDTGSILVDYKTCVSCHPDDLEQDIRRYRYDAQADWMRRGAQALGLISEPNVAFVFQEKESPHAVLVVTLDEPTMIAGRMLNDRALALFARGLATGEWKGYADDIVTLGLPEHEHRRIQRDSEAGLYDVTAILKGVQIRAPERALTAAERQALDAAETP